MNIFLLYLLKSTICMSGLYLVFRILMQKQTFFQLNRVILLSIVAFSVVIPLVHLPQTMQPVVSFQWAPVADKIKVYDLNLPMESVLTGTEDTGQPVETTSPQFAIAWPLLFQRIYFSGLFLALLVSMVGFLKLFALARRTPIIKKAGFRLVILNENIPALSFGKTILISQSDYENNRDEMITHEKAHIRLGHFYDLIFLELVKIIYWFNPVIYWLTGDLKAVHEFQADQSVLDDCIDAARYQLLIIQKGAGDRKFALANSFNHCKIKTRIKMINTRKSNKYRHLKAAAFIPVIALLMMAFGQRGQNVVHKSLNAGKNQLDTLIAGKRLIIRDTIQYDASFIKGLKMSPGYEKIEVTDENFYYTYRPNTKPDTLITYKYTIPTNLELNKVIVFSTRNKDTSLVLKRTNYTNIEYQIKNGKETIQAGTAILQSTFYFGAEMDHDENGKEIASEQYLNLTSDLDWAELEVEIYQAKIASITYCVDTKAKKFETLSKLLRE